MLEMLTLFIIIYFQPNFIQIKKEMYCLGANLAFITAWQNVEGESSI